MKFQIREGFRPPHLIYKLFTESIQNVLCHALRAYFRAFIGHMPSGVAEKIIVINAVFIIGNGFDHTERKDRGFVFIHIACLDIGGFHTGFLHCRKGEEYAAALSLDIFEKLRHFIIRGVTGSELIAVALTRPIAVGKVFSVFGERIAERIKALEFRVFQNFAILRERGKEIIVIYILIQRVLLL